MAELVPVPLLLQLQRAFIEYEREGRIFHLPKEKFFSGLPGLDLSVVSNGHRASTPLGPAAGPHTQMLQNIVLCWLGGSRIIELKTVQLLDELAIPRPCIDSANITYNVEWSQELKLVASLREYVSAAMFLQVLKASNLLGELYPADADETVFDMSIGYNLEGIRSPRVRTWIEGMKDASAIIDELRMTLTGRFRQFRDLPLSPRISDTITLSTFHGCPAEEIESIVTFLLKEMDLHVCVKMNPTLLGKETVEHLLYDVLGYKEVILADETFARDMKFADAADLVPRLDAVARAHGKHFSVKFSNTLVVRNHRKVFRDQLMYMSGPALHVLTLNLVRQFRQRVGGSIPISFSAGVTAQNVADMVAMNFVPVTTCTDLLKPGGYGRLHRYIENLAAAMRSAGATTIPEFVFRRADQGRAVIQRTAEQLRDSLQQAGTATSGTSRRAAADWISHTLVPELEAWTKKPDVTLRAKCDAVLSTARMHSDTAIAAIDNIGDLEQILVENAGWLNTPLLVERETADPRYRSDQNRTSPRKTGAKLSLYDCIACDKCVTACPNMANFPYDATPVEVAYRNYELHDDGSFAPVVGDTFKVKNSRQFANYADLCNDCGNCDTACPEEGGPNLTKPRFFSSLRTYQCDAGQNGFLIEFVGDSRVIHGTMDGKQYKLSISESTRFARFTDEGGEYIIQTSDNELVSWNPINKRSSGRRMLNLLPYLQLKFLLDAVADCRHVNYVNAGVQGVAH